MERVFLDGPPQKLDGMAIIAFDGLESSALFQRLEEELVLAGDLDRGPVVIAKLGHELAGV